MDIDLLQTIIFFLLVAFLPSIFWIGWLMKGSNTVLSMSSLLIMFIWGAGFAVIIAIILEILAPGFSPREYGEYATSAIFMAVVIAPFAEEFAKPLGLKLTGWDIGSLQDGIILGATAGLGFAATENLLYELSALNEGGWGSFLLTAILRSFAACALHASATAMTGQGYARYIVDHSSWLIIIPFYLLAVLMHGLYNYLASSASLIAFFGAMGLAMLLIFLTKDSAS